MNLKKNQEQKFERKNLQKKHLGGWHQKVHFCEGKHQLPILQWGIPPNNNNDNNLTIML